MMITIFSSFPPFLTSIHSPELTREVLPFGKSILTTYIGNVIPYKLYYCTAIEADFLAFLTFGGAIDADCFIDVRFSSLKFSSIK